MSSLFNIFILKNVPLHTKMAPANMKMSASHGIHAMDTYQMHYHTQHIICCMLYAPSYFPVQRPRQKFEDHLANFMSRLVVPGVNPGRVPFVSEVLRLPKSEPGSFSIALLTKLMFYLQPQNLSIRNVFVACLNDLLLPFTHRNNELR